MKTILGHSACQKRQVREQKHHRGQMSGVHTQLGQRSGHLCHLPLLLLPLPSGPRCILGVAGLWVLEHQNGQSQSRTHLVKSCLHDQVHAKRPPQKLSVLRGEPKLPPIDITYPALCQFNCTFEKCLFAKIKKMWCKNKTKNLMRFNTGFHIIW